MPEVSIPNDWRCRPHQVPLWSALSPPDGLRRGIAVWHRRAGKDSTALNLTAVKAHQRVGTYWHLLPTLTQARRVVWNETDGAGRRIIDQAFPKAIRESTNQGEMNIRFLNGSLWQLGGSDNYDSLVGTNVRGVVFSEWALCDPSAWDYIRPILVENDGWALFIYTPRGRNHGYDLWEAVRQRNSWFAELLNIEQTEREPGVPIVTPEQVQAEMDEGMSYERAQQEFYCSFAAGVVGAYFAREVERAREEGRIGVVPYDRRRPVHAYLDIGIDDATAAWFGQREDWQRKWIGYREWTDTPLLDVFIEMEQMPYRWGSINLPHDARQRDKGTGRRIAEYAADVFDSRTPIVTHPAYNVQDSIETARFLVSQSWFDEENCKRGLDCLMNYAKVWDEKRKVYQLNPLHNWASHGSDAWRLAGMDDADEPVRDVVEGLYRPIRVIRSI